MAEGGTVIEDTVDSYEVFHRNMLGGGTFGTVFLGRDMRTNESVAIKCIEPPIQYRARYMRYIENELHALNSIDHPNVVDLIHYKEIGHCMYFILECCECDLQKFAIENDVFQELKFDFIQGLAEGVNCLHCHRIIHRDIKPENVLVKEAHGTRTAKLTDLGLSRRVPEGGSASCSFTPGVGTRHWMAPEVFADSDGHARYSKPSDIYSFGLLSGSVIVHNPGESLCPLSGPHGVCIGQWTHEQQSAGQTVNIPQLTGGEDSAEVQAMKQSIERMIHPEASQRYKAQEVCNAIRNIVNGSFTRSMPAAAYIPPPATGLSVTQAGSHVRLSDVQCHAAPTGLGPAELSGVRQLMPATSDIPANDLLSMQDESSLQLSNVAENIVSQTDRSSQTGSLALQVENSKRPEKPEPQKAESASPASTIPPLPLSSHPDTSRLTLYPHDSVKQHDASHQIHPALESVQTQSKAMQKEVSSMKLQIEALTLKTTSTSGMEMEPAPTSAVQTATTSSPTKQAGQILHPLMQSEPTPTIKQQMELASTTVMDVEQTPSTTTNRDPNPVSDVDLPMQAETPKAHTQTEAAAGKMHKQHQQQQEAQRNYEYDAFVSYNSRDDLWITEELKPKLEDEFGLRLCLHQRDFVLGGNIMEQIVSSMDNSCKILLILSPNFLASDWCHWEMNIAHSRMVTRGTDVPMVILSPVSKDKMSRVLKYMLEKETAEIWSTDPYEQQLFWVRLYQRICADRRDISEKQDRCCIT